MLLALAALLGGLGATETARAAPAGARPLEFTARADTDTVVVAGRDTLPPDPGVRDTLDVPAADSVAVGDSAAADTVDTGPTDPPFPQQDDIFGQLLGEPGYQVIRYQGRGVELDVDGQRVQLNREAQVMYERSTIDADTITYEAGLQFVRGCGNISLAGEGENVISDECLNYDVSSTKGTVMDGRTSFAQMGADWLIDGDLTLRGSGTVFVETGDFTSCDADEPHYYFRAGQIKVVSDDIVVAWPVTLYIQNVPVAWLPVLRAGHPGGAEERLPAPALRVQRCRRVLQQRPPEHHRLRVLSRVERLHGCAGDGRLVQRTVHAPQRGGSIPLDQEVLPRQRYRELQLRKREDAAVPDAAQSRVDPGHGHSGQRQLHLEHHRLRAARPSTRRYRRNASRRTSESSTGSRSRPST